MPDFFERLAARSAGRTGPQPRALPRLAHAFERAGAYELDPEVAEVTAAPSPPAPTASAPPATAPVPGLVERHTETVRHLRELHRSTVVERRTETVASSVHRVLERLEVPAQPLLVPVPVPGPAAEVGPPEPAAASPVAPQPASAGPRPAPVRIAAAKAAPVAAPSRRARPEPERVVHVSIGRVEVKAAAPPARAARSGRRVAPAVELAKYLAREGS
jgi:hypothetical protein